MERKEVRDLNLLQEALEILFTLCQWGFSICFQMVLSINSQANWDLLPLETHIPTTYIQEQDT